MSDLSHLNNKINIKTYHMPKINVMLFKIKYFIPLDLNKGY